MKKTTLIKLNFGAFLNGFILLIVSVILLLIATPITIIFNMFFYIVTLKLQTGFNKLGEHMYKLAISIDQFGNVFCGDMFGVIFAKKNGYKFGHEDDTISYVLGRNKYRKTLRPGGKFMCSILALIETEHVEKAIKMKIVSDREAEERYHEYKYWK